MVFQMWLDKNSSNVISWPNSMATSFFINLNIYFMYFVVWCSSFKGNNIFVNFIRGFGYWKWQMGCHFFLHVCLCCTICMLGILGFKLFDLLLNKYQQNIQCLHFSKHQIEQHFPPIIIHVHKVILQLEIQSQKKKSFIQPKKIYIFNDFLETIHPIFIKLVHTNNNILSNKFLKSLKFSSLKK